MCIVWNVLWSKRACACKRVDLTEHLHASMKKNGWRGSVFAYPSAYVCAYMQEHRCVYVRKYCVVILVTTQLSCQRLGQKGLKYHADACSADARSEAHRHNTPATRLKRRARFLRRVSNGE